MQAAASAAMSALPATDAPLLVTCRLRRAGGAWENVASVGEGRTSGASAAEPIDTTPNSYLFSGRHDHGALPTLPADGHYTYLVRALLEAKDTTDALMKALSQQEAVAAKAAAGAGAQAAGRPASKRRRMQEVGDGEEEEEEEDEAEGEEEEEGDEA